MEFQNIKPKLKNLGWPLIFIGVLIIIVFLFLQDNDSKVEETSGNGSELTAIPDPDIKTESGDKIDSYLRHDARPTNNVDLYDSTYVTDTSRNVDPCNALGGATPPANKESSGKITPSDLTGTQPQTPANGSGGDKVNPYRISEQEREQRHRRRREEAIALADHMTGKDDEEGERQEAQAVPQRVALPEPEAIPSDGIITSLTATSRSGISSLSPQAQQQRISGPVKCMFLCDGKLRSGQRVAVRLMEDLYTDSFVVPKNTHLMAYVSVSTRLELEFANVDLGGRILPLGYEAFDMDGTRGLYCPQTSDAPRTAKTSGLGIIGSTLSGKVGRIASEVINTGISIAQSAGGERTVSVTQGYRFLIAKKKEL